MNEAIYNENDPYAAAWLERLIERGLIAPGRVDRRSIVDLKPADVAGPGQRHFFAGIGGWSYAQRLAGVPDDADIWTGSCPCQGLSDAGKRLGVLDPRHLWPAWFALIRECRPPTIFGEQVASRLGLAWLDLVRSDLEGCGYAVGASDLCAASVGAPHIRQRLFFVAHAGGEPRRLLVPRRSTRRADAEAERSGEADILDDASSSRSGRNPGAIPDAKTEGQGEWRRARRIGDEPSDAGADVDGTVADMPRARRPRSGVRRERTRGGESSHGGEVSPWSDVEWLPCTDGASRPVEPGLEPLAHGVSGRMVVRRTVESAESSHEEEHWYNRCGALVGLGNAIVPQVAAAFIAAAIGEVK